MCIRDRRLDSGNDAEENFTHFGQSYFIVKRNLRKESREQWLATARQVGQLESSREGKNVYTGFVDHLRPGGAKSSLEPVPVAFEVIERLTDPDGNYLRHYCPELGALPLKYLHKPWQAPADQLRSAQIRLGVDYPEPILDLKLTRERALESYRSLA